MEHWVGTRNCSICWERVLNKAQPPSSIWPNILWSRRDRKEIPSTVNKNDIICWTVQSATGKQTGEQVTGVGVPGGRLRWVERLVREGLIAEVTFEQRPEWTKGESHGAIWERAFQAEGAAHAKALRREHECVQGMVGRVVRMEWVMGRGWGVRQQVRSRRAWGPSEDFAFILSEMGTTGRLWAEGRELTEGNGLREATSRSRGPERRWLPWSKQEIMVDVTWVVTLGVGQQGIRSWRLFESQVDNMWVGCWRWGSNRNQGWCQALWPRYDQEPRATRSPGNL